MKQGAFRSMFNVQCSMLNVRLFSLSVIRPLSSVLCLLISVLCPLTSDLCLAADIAPRDRWYIDYDNPSLHRLEIRRGSTLILEPTVRQNGTAVDLTDATNVFLAYKAINATNFYAVTGSVYSATGGVIQIRWTSAQETTNSALVGDIYITSTNATAVRCPLAITLTADAMYQSTATNPTPRTSIDGATTTVLNPGLFPWFYLVGSPIVGQSITWNGTNWIPSSAGAGDMVTAMYDPAGAHTTVVFVTDTRLTDSRAPLAHTQAWSTISSAPTSLSGYGVTDAVIYATDTRLTDSRAPLGHTQAWSTISSAPTSLSGYGVTDAVIYATDARLTDSRAPLGHTQAWSTISSAPTSLSGYGITDTVNNASSLTNWPVQFSTIYSNNITGSNNILVANGNCQILVVTAPCTNYLPTRLSTAFESIYVQFNIGANTFSVNTNNVAIGTNYLGQGSWPVFRTNGVQGLHFLGNYGDTYWRGFPL
jgi:hypothetical protein